MGNFNLPTVVLLIAIVVCVLLILRYIRRHKKKIFSCGGDCAHCMMGCGEKEREKK